MIDAVLAVTNGGSSNVQFLELAGLLFGGGAMAAWISGRHRVKSGEDRASASEANAQAASEMAGAVHDVLGPLREENARLLGRIMEMQSRLNEKTEIAAELRVALTAVETEYEKYRHRIQSDITALEARLATAKLQMADREREIERLEIELGRRPGTRSDDSSEAS